MATKSDTLPKLAKQQPDGRLLCAVCKDILKDKVFFVKHLQGKVHLDAVDLVKQKAALKKKQRLNQERLEEEEKIQMVSNVIDGKQQKRQADFDVDDILRREQEDEEREEQHKKEQGKAQAMEQEQQQQQQYVNLQFQEEDYIKQQQDFEYFLQQQEQEEQDLEKRKLITQEQEDDMKVEEDFARVRYQQEIDEFKRNRKEYADSASYSQYRRELDGEENEEVSQAKDLVAKMREKLKNRKK